MATLPRALIVGCGYVGQRLARSLSADHILYGIVRGTTNVRTLRALGIEPIVLDLDAVTHRDLSPTWYRASPIFYFAPPPQNGESDARIHGFLNALIEQPAGLIYISTTGVYGDLRGAVADESTSLNPSSPRARRRASAEEITRVWCHEHSVRRVVLRVPAIYGPGRLPLDRLRSGEPTVIESEAPIINRIHVDDLVNACVAVANNANARGVYNISDGNELTMTAYLNRVAMHAQLPAPSQISLEHAQLTLKPEMLSYLGESRRISSSRIRSELGIELRYADVDAGIVDSLKEEAANIERRDDK